MSCIARPRKEEKGEDVENKNGIDEEGELAHGWRPPRGGERAQRDTPLS